MVRHIIKKPIEAEGDCQRSMGQVSIWNYTNRKCVLVRESELRFQDGVQYDKIVC